MQRTIPLWRGLLLALAGMVILAGCSGGNNKNNNTNATTRAATTATTASVVRTAAPPTAIRTGTASVTARTPAPIVAAAKTASPAAGTGTVTTPSAGSSSGDAALQQILSDAALKETDLPPGFTAQGLPSGAVNLPGESAAYSATYLNISRLPQIQAVVLALGAFKDAQVAVDNFKMFEQQIAAESGADFKLVPEPGSPNLGDEAKSFKLTGTANGITLGGYAIIWRRGRIASVVVLAGSPEVQSINDVAPLAQKQDDKLKAEGQ